MKYCAKLALASLLFVAVTSAAATAWEQMVGLSSITRGDRQVFELAHKVKPKPQSFSPIQPPSILNQGLVSTSTSPSSTWLGGWGTGGLTNGSWFYRYTLFPGESIRWVIRLNGGGPTDYDMYLYQDNNGIRGSQLASAVRTTYPDTLKYDNSSSIRPVFFEVRYYSGQTNGVFGISNVFIPYRSDLYFYISEQGLRKIPRSNPTDGIEGCNDPASGYRSHWYYWLVNPAWSDTAFTLALRGNSSGPDFDLNVYDSNFNLITTASGTGYPDETGWIAGYAGQYIYLEVYDYSNTLGEYRVDTWRTVLGVEENNQTGKMPASFRISALPNPFSSTTNLAVQSSTNEKANVRIYDLRGNLENTLSIPTNHPTVWDGRGRNGRKLPAGVYFFRATAGDYTATEKVVITR